MTVVTLVGSEEEKTVAVLRDIADGTGVSPEDLRKLGFTPQIIASVGALTRRKSESLEQHLGRVFRDKTGIAMTVVKASLAFESRRERAAGVDEFTKRRLRLERERTAALLDTSLETLADEFAHSPYNRGVDADF